MAYVTKYGCRFDASRDPLEWEFDCIRQGGRWKHPKTGEDCGDGLFNHLMTARKLIWPHRYRHRWTDLMYENFIENDVTTLLGAASTQKTSHAVEYCILNYWARPENTLVILSTVNMDKLDIGIWAELQMLWNQGRARYDWLAGNIVPYKRAITTHNLEDDGLRDFRCGAICRPCFPSGTLVDTPLGQVPIETLNVGDEVINAFGIGRIKQTSTTRAERLVRVRINDGREIDCTPEHPFLTDKGWKNAIDLDTSDLVFSADETVQMLRQSTWGRIPESKVLFISLPSTRNAETVQVMRENVSSLETAERELLQYRMCRTMGSNAASYLRNAKDVQALWKATCSSSKIKVVLLRSLSSTSHSDALQQMRKTVRVKGELSREKIHFLQSVLFSEMARTPDFEKEQHPHKRGVGCLESVSKRVHVEFSDTNWESQNRWQKALVQSRHRFSCNQTGCRDRRRSAQNPIISFEGQEKGFNANGNWVESVEILEQRGDKRFEAGRGGYTVHNLEVTGHPSYSVNNVIVHNCYVGGRWVGLGVLAGLKQDYIFYVADELQFMSEGFSGSWPHLFSNGTVKIIGSANPKHDPEDEAGKAAEPVEGWNAHPEPEKTEVWPTKFMGGKCVNLVGTDSPNFDVPEGQPEPFPRLIGRKFAKRIAHDHGEGSFEFYRLVKGVMKVAFAGSRVITRQMCREHHALEGVRWKDDKQVHLYALDPSYGGEDRCVGMPLKFGEDVDGNQILLVMPYRVYKLDLRKEKEVEDQIADIFSEELTLYDVPPENAFYDSCGKGTIGAAFARKFGFRVPVAVDSGMQPTRRPVREDLFVDEKDGTKRLKRCDEHYAKFVSELWFSAAYTIQSDQMRGLTEDVMAEGCARMYEIAMGNKIKVESKTGTNEKEKESLKRRLGKSPDLFDCLVIGVEGARQRGFKIKRLGASSQDDGNNGFQWLADRVRKHESFVRSKQLEYAQT